MSVISTLDQLPLPLILRRIETYTKTGLMTVTHDSQTIEIYFQKGKLMYAAFAQVGHKLGERLLHDRMISEQMLRDAVHSTHESAPSETRLALALMNLGYLRREELREWMKTQVTAVMQTLLSWKQGSVAIEEDEAPPTERLLVSLDISPLLDTMRSVASVDLVSSSTDEEEYAELETRMMPTSPSMARSESLSHHATKAAHSIQLAHAAQPDQMLQPIQSTSGGVKKRDVAQAPTLVESSQFYARSTESPLPLSPSMLAPQASEASATISASSFIDADAFFSALSGVNNTGQDLPLQSTPPASLTPILPYVPPRRVDTSFMKPDMVMVPINQSTAREQQVQITPEQWLLLTRVDGQTSLQELCTLFKLSDVHVCELAGELIAERLIQVVPPQTLQAQQGSSPMIPPVELSPSSRELVMAGLHNGLATPGHHASVPPVWGDILPESGITQLPSSFEAQPYLTHGNNSISSVMESGWTSSPQLLSSPSNSSFVSGFYPVAQRR